MNQTNMPTSHQQYDDSAAAVDMTSGGGDDSLDDLVMMASAPSTATAVVGGQLEPGKRKLDDDLTADETSTQHPHDNDVVAASTDPILLETTNAENEEMMPPSLPHATTTNPTLLPPQEVLHHNHIIPHPAVPQQQQHPPPNNTTTPLLLIRPSPEGQPTKPKSKRINWGKSPHKERLTLILNDWFSKSGMAIDPTTNTPISDYRVYATKVGISRTTLFKYIHKDPSKRRVLREEGGGMRGKKRLMTESEVRDVVRELKEGKDESTPPSRNEAVDLIVKRFGLSRQAASRQLSRHVMPMFHNEGVYLASGENANVENAAAGGKPSAAAVAAQVQLGDAQQVQVDGVTMMDTAALPNDTSTTSIHETKRSIVISGVTSGLGRALLGYFYNHGHTVAGCGRNGDEILVLQGQFPNAKLSVVDVANDKSVQLWAETVCSGGGVENATKEGNETEVDLVIANAGISPETLYPTKATAWEVPRQDFDDTIDVNVKGVANMIRHFVPRMVKNNNGTFVAMSSGLGRSPNPHQVAYCASKWAVEGMVKSLAMSLPLDGEMCAVPLAPGVVQTGVGLDGKTNEGSSSNGNIDKWIDVAGPMILGLSGKDNGKSLSVKGFYSVRYRQTWSYQDGSGIPDRVSHGYHV